MEIEIRRREQTGTGNSARNESETLAKYEIMDGAPVRGENIPIRSDHSAACCVLRLYMSKGPSVVAYGVRILSSGWQAASHCRGQAFACAVAAAMQHLPSLSAWSLSALQESHV